MSRKSVAIIGASTDRSKFGNKAVRAYMDQEWEVYPVNPKGGTIEGVTAYTSLADVRGSVDRVSLYLPPQAGVNVLPEIAAKKPDEFFVNPGAESDELVEKAKELGLEPIVACSIVAIGASPSDLPD